MVAKIAHTHLSVQKLTFQYEAAQCAFLERAGTFAGE